MSEHDDVGFNPLRVRTRAQDGTRAALELNRSPLTSVIVGSEFRESQLPFAIVESHGVEEVLAVWEEPRPVHAHLAFRWIGWENLPRCATTDQHAVDCFPAGVIDEDDAVFPPGAPREWPRRGVTDPH